MAESILSLSGVRADIDQYHILHGVDLEVPAGELTVLLGRNGAGKSTTLRTIMGLTTITGGKVRFRGKDIPGQPRSRPQKPIQRQRKLGRPTPPWVP